MLPSIAVACCWPELAIVPPVNAAVRKLVIKKTSEMTTINKSSIRDLLLVALTCTIGEKWLVFFSVMS